MNEKPPKRRFKLNVTEPPTRMLQEVVIKPAVDEQDAWLQYWYGNRQDILANNTIADDPHSVGDFFGKIFTPKKNAVKNAKKYLDALKVAQNNKQEYVVSHNPKTNQGIQSIQTAPDEIKQSLINSVAYDIADVTPKDLPLDKAIDYFPLLNRGLTIPKDKVIFYKEDVDPAIKVHERTHLYGPRASLKTIYGAGRRKSQRYIDRALKVERDGYLDSDEEIQARLNSLRYKLQLDPKKVWTIDEIRALTKDKRYNKKDLDLDRYTDEFLLHLFNEVADNNISKQQNKRHLDLIGDYA